MKLSKLYSNHPNLFQEILFESGLNVVLAEIRLPENKKKDTHNLGKTTLGHLLNFLLLARRNPKFFLFKHLEQFQKFIFFLELELLDGSYITIRRGVQNATKISFKKHEIAQQNFVNLAEDAWDHHDVPFERSLSILDALLDLRSLKPWTFRKGIGYQLRSQDDYRDVFQLRKFMGKHADWKPFLAHITGFNADQITSYYEKEKQIEDKKKQEQIIQSEFGGSLEDISKVEGMILLKQKELEKKQAFLDAFDFRSQDKEHTEQLVDMIDERIATLNAECYSLQKNQKKINDSLEEEQILFHPDDAERLFKESGILFAGQIKKDFQQLIAFNRAITDERCAYLQEELREIEDRLKEVNAELDTLGKQRSETLSFLNETNVFNKYKKFSNELITLKADLSSLERQRDSLRRLQELRTSLRRLKEKLEHLQSDIELDVERQNSDPACLFSSIRLFFNEIVEEVIDRKALLNVALNREGHLEFKDEILDESGNTTSADSGTTYKKLLCTAFDLAVLRAYLDKKFPHFVFHDGVFESLDNRKKENLLNVIRRYSDLGIQVIITLIDSDLPPKSDRNKEVFGEQEIILTLHDENEQGRLFKMASW
ncbi:MAG: DUF2326 domain-containing protein [Candidatus Electrothrix sp. GW3-4]|uniref:DUF2326 domain-containing protein n=1 Tax=Candidatus Electrothrix sp. GW3-4 TaxID=3126740 RepID=UPI0030CC22B5